MVRGQRKTPSVERLAHHYVFDLAERRAKLLASRRTFDAPIAEHGNVTDDEMAAVLRAL